MVRQYVRTATDILIAGWRAYNSVTCHEHSHKTIISVFRSFRQSGHMHLHQEHWTLLALSVPETGTPSWYMQPYTLAHLWRKKYGKATAEGFDNILKHTAEIMTRLTINYLIWRAAGHCDNTLRYPNGLDVCRSNAVFRNATRPEIRERNVCTFVPTPVSLFDPNWQRFLVRKKLPICSLMQMRNFWRCLSAVLVNVVVW